MALLLTSNNHRGNQGVHPLRERPGDGTSPSAKCMEGVRAQPAPTRTDRITAHVCTQSHTHAAPSKENCSPTPPGRCPKRSGPFKSPETEEEAALTGLPPGEDGPRQTHEQGGEDQ